jgi:hypothetical protein
MIGRIVQEGIDGSRDLDPDWVPAENVSRDAWQEIAEECVLRLRRLARRPAFGLGEAEISIHYHKPVREFARLLSERLGVPRP